MALQAFGDRMQHLPLLVVKQEEVVLVDYVCGAHVVDTCDLLPSSPKIVA